MLPTPRGERPQSDQTPRQPNEGEGNKTAARAFNHAQSKFAKSGEVDAAAKAAKRAVEGEEKAELSKAEQAGRSKARR
jgi:hypothetical protein